MQSVQTRRQGQTQNTEHTHTDAHTSLKSSASSTFLNKSADMHLSTIRLDPAGSNTLCCGRSVCLSDCVCWVFRWAPSASICLRGEREALAAGTNWWGPPTHNMDSSTRQERSTHHTAYLTAAFIKALISRFCGTVLTQRAAPPRGAFCSMRGRD